MVPSPDILGEMDESDRHVLMRAALRAKHLRFLRARQTDWARRDKGETIACGGRTDPKPATEFTNSPGFPDNHEALHDQRENSHDKDLSARSAADERVQRTVRFGRISMDV